MGGLFTQSVGRKLLMSLAGIFLLVFLLVHLAINLLVMIPDKGELFNLASNFMRTNWIIKTFEIVLLLGFLIHMFYGIRLSVQNWMSRPKKYKISPKSDTSPFSRYMFHTSIIITIFLIIHLMDFYFTTKFGAHVATISYDGGISIYENMGQLVIDKFKMPGFVIFYLLSFIILGFHLLHGFKSAFQTLGLNDQPYSQSIRIASYAYSAIIVLGFSLIPLYVYFFI